MAFVIPIAIALASAASIVSAIDKPKPPKAPDESQQGKIALEAAQAQAQLQQEKRGYASTILTSPMGDMSSPTVQKTILG
jgi:hypothetical protein